MANEDESVFERDGTDMIRTAKDSTLRIDAETGRLVSYETTEE